MSQFKEMPLKKLITLQQQKHESPTFFLFSFLFNSGIFQFLCFFSRLKKRFLEDLAGMFVEKS